MTKRKLLFAILPILVVLGAVSGWAYWTTSGSGTASASNGTLNAPSITDATPGAGTVLLTWTAVAAPASPAVSYFVTRDGGTPGGDCPTAAAPTGVLTCTDSGVTTGSHDYTVTAVWRTWTATSATETVAVAQVLDHFTVAPTGTTQTAGSAFSVTVTAKDASNVTIPTYTGTIQFTSDDGQAVLPSDYTFVGGDNGSHTFTNGVTLKTASAGKTIYVADGGATGTATYTVDAAAASAIALSGSTGDLGAGASRSFMATIEDAYGNTVTTGADSSVSVSFAQSGGTGSVSGTGAAAAVAGVATKNLTGGAAGSVTIQASATLAVGGTSSNTLSFDVVAAAADHIDLAPVADAVSGQTRLLTATIKDAAGNTVTSDNSTSITFAKTAGSGTVSGLGAATAVAGVATKSVSAVLAGSITLAASASSPAIPAGASATFTITHGTAQQLVLSGATSDLASGATRTVTATITDSNGNTVDSGPDSTVNINFAQTTGAGSLSGTGSAAAVAGVATKTVTGNLAGSVSIQASTTLTGGPATSNTLTFNVVAGAASQIALTGAVTDLTSATARTFTATVKDAAGNTVTTGGDSTVSVNFAQTAGAGSVSGAGAAAAVAGVATKSLTGTLAGSVTVRANATLAGGATNSNTLTFNVVAGAASQIALTGAVTDLSSGTPRTFTATVQDVAGNTVTTGGDSTVSINFAQTAGAGSVSGTGSASAVAGVATKNLTGVLAGSVTIRASATLSGPGAVNSNTLTFNVVAGAASQIALTGAVTDLTSATARTFTATVKDAAGNTVTAGGDSTVSVNFAQTAGAGSVSGAGAAAAVAGVATKSLAGTLAGSVTVRANATLAGGATNSNTLTFNVVAGAASQIALTGAVTDLSSGTPRTFTATVQDVAGNTVTTGGDSTVSINFAQTAGAGSVSGTGSASAVAGVATKNLTGVLANSVTIRASATLSGPGAVNSNTLTFIIVAGAPTKLQFTTSPSSSTGGTAFSTQPVVTVQDAAGNTVTGDTSNVTLATTGGTGTAGAALTCTANPKAAVAGVATFAGCKIDKTGTGYTLTATDGSLTSAISTSFAITVGAAAKLAFTTSPSASTGGTAFTTQPVVTVQDAGGNTVTGDTSTVTLAITGGTGTAGAALACTANAKAAVAGVATFAGCKIDKAGTNYTLTAGDGALTSASSATFNITVGAAAQFAVSAPTTATAGNAFSGITLTAQDAGGNLVTTYTGVHTIAWSGAATSPGGNPPTYPATSVSFTNGVSTTALSATLFSATGPNVLTASATTPSVTGSSATITVSAIAATKIAFANCSNPVGNTTCSGQPISIPNNTNMTFNIQAQDTYGNASAPSAALTISISSSNSADFAVASGSPATITPPATTSGSVTVSHNNQNTTSTITAHVTSGPALADATMTVKR